MRWKPPMFAHVWLWFSVNLAVMALAGFLLLRFSWRTGVESFLGAQARPRLVSMATAVAGELREAKPEQWPTVLERLGTAFGVTLRMARPDGKPIHGVADWPEEVAKRLEDMADLRGGDARPPRPGGASGFRPPPQQQGRGEGWERVGMQGEDGPAGGMPPPPVQSRPEDRTQPPGDPGEPAGGGGGKQTGAPMPPPRPMPPQLLFFLKGEAAPGYWAALSLQAGPPGRDYGPGPHQILVVGIPSLGAGGLVADPTPWLWAGVGAVCLSALVWWLFVRGVTVRLREMGAATARMARGEFDVTVRPGAVRELADLAASIQVMAEKLNAHVSGQKRFLGDVAHELCSPLARLEMGLGILEQRLPPGEGDPIADVREETREMATLVNELLAFSKASLVSGGETLERVELAGLVSEVAKREGVTDIHLDVPEALAVRANPDLLRRALANILRNALRHAGPGSVTVAARQAGGMVDLTVADQGPGIPEVFHGRVFEAFFRLDESRARATGGTGLGLAIVKACIEGCGGSVGLRNLTPRGLELRVTLPAS